MQKNLFLIFFLISNLVWTQFTENDVKFFVGEGEQKAFMIIDFKDGTDDRSYAWGIKFNEGDNLTFGDFLTTLSDVEPNFSVEFGFGGAFLSDIVFNSHSGLEGEPDWWSTWSGNSSDSMSMNGGISDQLIDGRWYGASYGFSNPEVEHPATPIPAYHSLWFGANEIGNWFGEGQYKNVVIIDFGTDTEGEADSFVFGIQHSQPFLTMQDALEILATQVVDFSYEINEENLLNISWNSFTATSTDEQAWKVYLGTDLSNWTTQTDLNAINLESDQWLGLGFGNRRPFIPREEGEQLGVAESALTSIQIYPNPASSHFYVSTHEISDLQIFDLNGKLVKSMKQISNLVPIQDLNKGLYIVKFQSNGKIHTQKLIVK